MTLNFAHKDWSTNGGSHGIQVSLMNMHGDADAFTTHSRQFPLTNEGVADAEALLRALDVLSDAILGNRDASLEDVCAKISPKVGLSEDALCEMLDAFVRSDAQFDDYIAKPVAYRFSVTDDNGTRYALYPGRGGMVRFKALSYVDQSYFEDWA